jgi:DNA polymerase-3 subunit delta
MALISEAELRQRIKTKASGAYVLFGEEDYLKAASLADLRAMAVGGCEPSLVQFNRTVLTEENYSPEALLGGASAVPVMNDMRITEAEVRLGALREDQWKSLLSVLSEATTYRGSVTVVKCPADAFDHGDLPKRPSAKLKELAEAADCVYFGFQPEFRLKKWLMRHFLSQKMKTDDAALNKIIEICGTDMFTLRGEVDKLCAYAASHGTDYVDDTMPPIVCSANEHEVAFELTNAIISANKQTALTALKRYKDRRESPVAVMGMITRAVSDMMYISALAASGKTKKEISDALKIHEYRVEIYMNAVRGVDPERLYDVMLRCRETDGLLKSSTLGYEAIERFICALHY